MRRSTGWRLFPLSRLANYYGTAITQSGQCETQYDTANVPDSGYTYYDQGRHPMWAAGLNVRHPVLSLWAPFCDLHGIISGAGVAYTP